jgi:hypothetical protein
MGEINAMCTKSTMLELIFRGDPSGTCALGYLCPLGYKDQPESN